MPRGPKRLRTPEGKLNAIGARLQQLRLEKSLTQDELAARIGTVADWGPLRESLNQTLRGERIIGDLELCAIADAIGCNPIWLTFGYGDPWRRPEGFAYKPYSDTSTEPSGVSGSPVDSDLRPSDCSERDFDSDIAAIPAKKGPTRSA